MGQGSLTSLPLILAEELDADWAKVRVVVAPPNDELYKNPAFGYMYTAGSNAVTAYFRDLRQFGAQVRKVLLANAAKHWNVPVEELTTGPNVVIHEKIRAPPVLWRDRRLRRGSGQGAGGRGERAQEAGSVPPHRQGRDARRAAAKGERHRAIRIDVQVPGMLYGAILRAPVEGAGARQRSTIAKAQGDRRRVVQIVRLPYGVGVIAETPWAAFDGQGRAQRHLDPHRQGVGLRQREGARCSSPRRRATCRSRRSCGASRATRPPRCRRRRRSSKPSTATISSITPRWSR